MKDLVRVGILCWVFGSVAPLSALERSKQLVQEGIHHQRMGQDGEALRCFEVAGDMGDAEGQYYAGYQHLSGLGTIRRNESRAFEWLKRSAEGGEARGQRLLGNCYENGWGTPRDLGAAKMWYQKAAQGGELGARSALDRLAGVEPASSRAGEAVDQGQGGNAEAAAWTLQGAAAFQQGNYQEAIPLLKKAAAAGNPEGQTLLAVSYIQGFGVKKDLREALKWVRRASAQGEPGSQVLLAVFYLEGKLVKKDVAKAKGLLQSAAAKGSPEAQQILAKLN